MSWCQRGYAAAAAAVMGLTGCASVPDGGPWVSGRLAIAVAASPTAPARGFHAAFDLQGDAQRGRLELSTPLGPRLVTATWAPGEVVLLDGRAPRRYADLAELAQDVMGEPLPLQALPNWLRGQPWPGASHQAIEGGFMQLGWTLDTSQLQAGLLIAQRPAPPAVTLRVRLSERAAS